MNTRIGSFLLIGLLTAGILTSAPAAGQSNAVDLSRLVARATPGAELHALEPLAGHWRVEKSIFVAMGTPERPATSSDMTTTRKWIADGKFLEDRTTGTVNGHPYLRIGYLGYNPMDRRYEWNTIDNITTIMMTYHGRNDSGATRPIDVLGSFTDLGVTGEANVGKTVQMRTRITIIDNDHHRFQIFFTPSGGQETLADQMDYTRIP